MTRKNRGVDLWSQCISVPLKPNPLKPGIRSAAQDHGFIKRFRLSSGGMARCHQPWLPGKSPKMQVAGEKITELMEDFPTPEGIVHEH